MIKIGLIGYNEGNGHPYSFSAIINGYDKENMHRCPYSAIYDYLEARPPHEIGLPNMTITHIWCPDRIIAEDIAKCTNILNVVEHYPDMTEYIDAIIIARDDVDSHFELTKFFLEKGKYVFVDKPLCSNKKELDYFEPFLYNAQLMSCSGLRYKDEIRTAFYGRLKKDDVLFVNGFSVIDWYKYAIHILEGVTPIMGTKIKKIIPLHTEDYYFAKIEYHPNKYLLININKKEHLGIRAHFYCKEGKEYILNFDDNFGCFKYMLQEFHRMILSGKPVIDPNETITILETLMEGEKNAYK